MKRVAKSCHSSQEAHDRKERGELIGSNDGGVVPWACETLTEKRPVVALGILGKKNGSGYLGRQNLYRKRQNEKTHEIKQKSTRRRKKKKSAGSKD